MNISAHFRHGGPIGYFPAVAMLCLLAGCSQPESDALQGYVEGEFVYVSSPLSGAVEKLYVQRGGQVKAGDPLFALECGAETAARELAAQRLEEGRAYLEDARKGLRPPEIASIEAQLNQSRTAFALSEKELARLSSLFDSGSASMQELDKAKSVHDQNQQRVSQLVAELKTAGLGARDDQVIAAEASVRALEASLAKADWSLSQKSQSSPQDALVFDTLYRAGEFVAAGRPVVALLPPANIKVRSFVPETIIGTIHPGQQVRISVDGVSEPFIGKVSYISPQAEYTPPVIYNKENREKLVFMIEAVFDPKAAARLHPGQPVDLEFSP